ncbi:hypothetical protein C8R43DRAFT_587413 [Mycena crocata]|nr:hypothetical protein C8R43DRAFT_587413 [Mycena crocata]
MAADFKSDVLPEVTARAHIRDLLRSHANPPGHILSTLSALSDELWEYDLEIARLTAKLTRMQADRAVLQAHYTDCCGLFAPIRRLPAEILLEIFRLCWSSFKDASDNLDMRDYPKATDLSLLANSPVLALSQVCARWHSIAMSAGILWDTIELDESIWAPPSRTETIMDLLRAALTRGGECPLRVIVYGANPPPALELLAQHSERWRKAEFICPLPVLKNLSGLKGRFPVLHTLEVSSWASPQEQLDLFEVAPSLTSLTISGQLLRTAATPPRPQFSVCKCIDLEDATEIATATSFMSDMSSGTSFGLVIHFTSGTTPIDLTLPPISSDIRNLSMGARGDFGGGEACIQALHHIFASLTLPHLHRLEFNSEEYPELLLPWPHAAILALSGRSAFDTHLQVLRLGEIVITEVELIECLSVLPALQELEISDHQVVPQGVGVDNPHPLIGGVAHLLITDNLFAKLTKTPDSNSDSPCLVPNLRCLDCISILRFDHNAFLDCLLSRMREGSRFECGLWWLPGRRRDLDPHVVARIDALRVQKQLTFRFKTAPPDI